VRVRLVAGWRGAELDRLLAAGADPHASVLLAERARKLTTPGSRKRVAEGLRRACRSAQATPGLSAAVRPNANELLAARAVLAAIDSRLRSPDAVRAQAWQSSGHSSPMARALCTSSILSGGSPASFAQRRRR